MTPDTNLGGGDAGIHRFEDYRYVHGPICALLLSMVAERSITLFFWHLEANPLVTELGPIRWTLLTLSVLVVLVWVWYLNMGFDVWINRYLVYALTVLHTVAAVSNLAVVIF